MSAPIDRMQELFDFLAIMSALGIIMLVAASITQLIVNIIRRSRNGNE